MSIISLIIIIVLIVLAIVAFKFLVGAAKHIVSIALFAIAAIVTLYFLTGFDVFGIGHTAGAAVKSVTGLLP